MVDDLVVRPSEETIVAMLDYHRPILARRQERLAALRSQSGVLIQTELTLLGLLLVVLGVLPAGEIRTMGMVVAALVTFSYGASILVQLPLHATRLVHELPNEAPIVRVQFESTAPQIRAAELQATLDAVDDLRPRHERHAGLYRTAFTLFRAGTLLVGVSALVWFVAEVRMQW